MLFKYFINTLKIDAVQLRKEKENSVLIFIKYFSYWTNLISFIAVIALCCIQLFIPQMINEKDMLIAIVISTLSFFIETLAEINIKYTKNTFIIYRSIFIFVLLLASLFILFKINIFNNIIAISPRITLILMNISLTSIISILIYFVFLYCLMLFDKIENQKYFILYSYKIILYIFIIVGMFISLYLKDKSYFLTPLEDKIIIAIIEDSSTIYTHFILIFLIHNILIKAINYKIKYINHNQSNNKISKDFFLVEKFKKCRYRKYK